MNPMRRPHVPLFADLASLPLPRRDKTILHLTTVHRLRDPRIFDKEVRSVQEAGYRVHLLAQHPCDETVEGLSVLGLPPTPGRYRRLPLLRRAYQRARAVAADLYHFHDPELIPVAYALKKATGARVVYDMHEDYRWHGAIEGRLLLALERWCFGWVDQVITVQPYLTGRAERHGAAATLIENYEWPATEAAPQPRVLGLPLRLLYTGVLSNQRGLQTLVTLAEKIAATGFNARLNVVGVCNLAADRREAEKRLTPATEAVLHRVGWDAYVPPVEIAPHRAEAHVGLALFDPHPGYAATLPTKFYEYLFAGLPILCSDFPKWRSFVAKHGCGAVVPPGDADAALAVLRAWASDPAHYAQLSRAAAEAAPQYHWAHMAERLIACYDALLL